ncbi:hypothetical protein [Sedimenticola sp.]|uniref:hypothetical protein n=1 Tax=Sedimenticola sp. TaxID=1940285 RepID=UPI003D108BBA
MDTNLRSVLRNSTFLLALIGLGFTSIPFIGSMKVNAHALANRPHYRIDDLMPGDYKILPDRPGSRRGMALLFYRSSESSVSVWGLPVYEDKFLLPDYSWWRWGHLCEDFRLDLERSLFRCFDQSIEDYERGQQEWRWDLSGKNLGVQTEDLIAIPGDTTRKYFLQGTIND